MYRIFLSILLSLLTYSLQAADLLREQRMADEIQDAILVGEPIFLKDGDHEFLAIHAESDLDRVLGGVIVIHGRGAHPDWVDVINPIRSELPARGWETLSLQMPVAEAGADDSAYQTLLPESFPRIAAGIDYFKGRDIENIVIVAHSLGTEMTAVYLGENPVPEVKAFVAVSMPAGRSEQGVRVIEALAKLQIPVFDIYGTRDIEIVLNSAKKRASAGRRAQNPAYTQVVLEGADHFFVGLEDELVSRTHAWLKRVSVVTE